MAAQLPVVQACIAPKPSRLRSAKEFRTKLASAFQPHATLAKIVTDGQLHELLGVLSSMSPVEFMQLPFGQRQLVLAKGQSIINSPQEKLRTARFEFLRVLPMLASHTKADQYLPIIKPAIEYAFEKTVSTSWTGHSGIRQALSTAASMVDSQNHKVIAQALLAWLSENGRLTNREKWFYHAVRSLIAKVLANSSCDESDCDSLMVHYNIIEQELQKISADENEVIRPDYEDGYTDR